MRVIFAIILSILCYLNIDAQVYNSTRYSTEDGLAQSQVRAILQDKKGYLWLGTRGGVSKFNGQEFVNFTPQTHPNLVGDFVSSLYEDAKGNIWIGSERGLSKFDGRTFENIVHAKDSVKDEVLCVTGDRKGTLWIGQEGSLVVYNGKTFKTKKMGSQTTVNALLYDSLDQHIWIGTNQGLYVCDASTTDLSEHTPFLPKVTIYSLLKDKNGLLWIGSNAGVYRFDGTGFQQYSARDGLPGNTVYTLCEDITGHIWAGTEGGVAYYQEKKWTIPLLDSRNLANVRSSVMDIEGNIWLGLDGGGIRKLTGGVFQKFNVENGLSSNIAKSFLEDEQGRIWISTYDNGINRYDGERFVQYKQKDGLTGNNISYSFRDSKGNLWFATYYNGLSKYKNGFQNFHKKDGLRSDSIYCVAEDHQGQIWVGTEHGISIYDGQRFSKGYTTNDGLIDNTVYTIYEDNRQNIWIGTPVGVSRLKDGIFTNYLSSEIGHTVIAILQDPQDRLWFATSEGLYLFIQTGFQRIKISEASGAHNVVSLVNEGKDYLWVGTENGAYRLNLKTFDATKRNRFEHYTEKDGLPSLECNGNAAFLDSQGNIWLGTTEGAIMRPVNSEQREEDIPPMLHITDVRLSLASTDWDSLGFELDPYTNLPQNLKLPYDENRLDFSFIGISLKSPNQIEYKFMLEGVDEEWSEETRKNSFSYTNLRPGFYTFKVIAKKESTVWNYDNPAIFSFQILNPWYMKWWFVLMMSILVMGLGWGIYWRITTDRRKKREEQHIKNTAEKLQLEHQALYAMMNPHFTFNALQSIQYFIHRQDRISANKFLSSFAKLMRQNLESTKSDFISLNEEVERLKLYLSLEKMRFPEKFEYEVVVEEEVDPYDTQLPPMILQPFVENSIKHGIMPLESEGKILVNVSKKDEDHLLIKIQDNGIGVETSKIKKANRPSDHVSRGMKITKDRLALFAKMMEKDYSVDIREIRNNGHVEGTMVELMLPLHQ